MEKQTNELNIPNNENIKIMEKQNNDFSIPNNETIKTMEKQTNELDIPKYETIKTDLSTSPSENLAKSEKTSSHFLTAFRDILIMEERLKYSWKLLKYRQRQYLILLGILALFIAYFTSNLLFWKQEDSFWKTINKITLFLLITVFIFICNNGDLLEPQKFVPQTNRTLSKFGLMFDSNTKTVSLSNQPPNVSGSVVPTIYLPNPIDREKFSKGLKDFRNQHHQKLSYNPSSSTSKTKKSSTLTNRHSKTSSVSSPSTPN